MRDVEDKILDEIRLDLDELITGGGYAIEIKAGSPDVEVCIPRDIPRSVETQITTIVQQYGVKYRIVRW